MTGQGLHKLMHLHANYKIFQLLYMIFPWSRRKNARRVKKTNTIQELAACASNVRTLATQMQPRTRDKGRRTMAGPRNSSCWIRRWRSNRSRGLQPEPEPLKQTNALNLCNLVNNVKIVDEAKRSPRMPDINQNGNNNPPAPSEIAAQKKYS